MKVKDTAAEMSTRVKTISWAILSNIHVSVNNRSIESLHFSLKKGK
jgi:hypothetical protein